MDKHGMEPLESAGRSVIISDVTYEELTAYEEFVEGESWSAMLNYPTLFPSDTPDTVMMFVEASMGCGDSRWWGELLPMLEERFPDRIIHQVKFMDVMPY